MSSSMPPAGQNQPYRAAVIVASDAGARGERTDESGPLIREMLEAAGFQVASYILLPDDQGLLELELCRICDKNLADIILTSGGTGFSPRDCMPEATLSVADRLVPGIPEAMRMQSMGLTKRSMLSRAAAAIRGRTLIINLPGSPKAVRENLGYIAEILPHGLDILTGRGRECAQP